MRTKRLARLALNAGFIMLVSIMCACTDQPILARPGGPLSNRGPGTREAAAAQSVSSGTSGLSKPMSTDAGSGEGGACAVGAGCPGPSAAGADLDAPPLGLLEPSTNLLPAGTISVTLHLTTTVPSNCRWSETAGTAYGLMTNDFQEGQGALSHTTEVNGLRDLDDRWFYVRCQDRPAIGIQMAMSGRHTCACSAHGTAATRASPTSTGTLSLSLAQFFAGYDLYIPYWWRDPARQAAAIRAINPNAKILRQPERHQGLARPGFAHDRMVEQPAG